MVKPKGWILSWRGLIAFGLFAIAAWQIGGGLYIHAKAQLAQHLMAQAWAKTLDGSERVRPWAWADAWPVARLQVPDLGIDQFVLSNASNRTLAFGPGHLIGSAPPGVQGHVIIGGHRDTHFSFMADLEPDMAIRMQDSTGRWQSYLVRESQVIDSRRARIHSAGNRPSLSLITCYPFDAVQPGGPLRYIAWADGESLQENQTAVVQTAPQ
ncbi:MAG: class GN sortase [Pseudomonadota bacterium]